LVVKLRATAGLAVVATSSMIAAVAVAPGGAAAAGRPRAHVAEIGTHYAVYKRVCSGAPKPGNAACMAIRSVPSTRSNRHAHPIRVDAGYDVGPSGYGLTPGDFATAYGFNPDSAAAAHQTVAIVDAFDDPSIASDLNLFDYNYHLDFETAGSFRVVNQRGGSNLPAADTTGWSGEESLDVETVRGVCHLCKIVLIEADSASSADLSAAVNTAVKKFHATEVSNSYGGPEGRVKPPSFVTKAAARPYTHKGVVITASTGDDGWFSWDRANEGQKSAESPNVPSSIPSVVSVGGTYLGLRADGTRRTESVWNANGLANYNGINAGMGGLGATGGGCSRWYNAKGWQAHVAGYPKTGCGKHRLAADVSADADPASGYDVYNSYDCGPACPDLGWLPIGGTSLSAPLIAAMWALAGGSGGVAYPALSLYGHLAQSPSAFYDVTKGGNSWCDKDPHCTADTYANTGGAAHNPNYLSLSHINLGTLDCAFKRKTPSAKLLPNNHQCNAVKGYDGPSGVGTPNGLRAFKPMRPTAKIHHGKAKARSKTTFSVGGSDPFPGGRFVKFHWAFGEGSASSKAAPTHVYKKPGKYTVSVKATDNYGRSDTASVTVRVS
jgi:subtilase family serine protease